MESIHNLLMSSLEFHKDHAVLGPLLFLIYINDITKLCLSPNTRLALYADDMLIYKSICSDTSYELQQDINLLSQWSEEYS